MLSLQCNFLNVIIGKITFQLLNWFSIIMALAICSSLGRSDGHIIQVTVTWEVTSRWPCHWEVTSLQVTSLAKIYKKFFSILNDVKLLKRQKWSKKKFSKILRCDVTWSDGQMAMSLEVTSLLKWWSLPIEVTVTCTSDEQMARANVNQVKSIKNMNAESIFLF